MIKELVILMVAFAAGVFLYFQFQGIPILPQVQFATDYVQSTIKSATSFLQTNPWLAPIIGTGAISIVPLVIKKYQDVKATSNAVSEQADQLKTQLYQTTNVATQIQTENLQLKEKVGVLEEQITALPTKTAELQSQLAAKTKEVQTLIDQKNQEAVAYQNIITELKMREKVIVK